MTINPFQASTDSDSTATSVRIVSEGVSMPLREQTLLESLLDPKLEWRFETRGDSKTWHCTKGDPFLSEPELFGGIEFDPSMGFGACLPKKDRPGIPEPATGWDWHNHRRDKLHSLSDAHEITITKTCEDWYRHYLRRGEHTVSYQVSFTDREHSTQRFIISGEQSSRLAEIFEQVVQRAQ